MSTATARDRAVAREDGPTLAVLAREIAALRARVALLEQRDRPTPHDPEADARLIQAIAAVVGGSVFSVQDLRALARRDTDLRAALHGCSRRAIGVWLRRLRDQPCGSFVLRREGRDASGAMWSLYVGHEHTQPLADP
jgi:hypothetical protein